MSQTKKRIGSLFLVFCMVFTLPIRYNYDKGETRIESGFSGTQV